MFQPSSANLLDHPLFTGLDSAEQQVVLGFTSAQSCAPGELLFQEGDEGDGLYVIMGGWIEVFTRSTFGEVHVLRLGPGEILGELAFLDAQPRNASARAITQVKAYRVDAGQFQIQRERLNSAAVKLTRAVASSLCARLRKTNELIAQVVLQQPVVPTPSPLVLPAAARCGARAHSNPVRAAMDRVALFQDMSERERAGLSAHLHLCALPGEHIIFAEGDPATSCLLLVKGRVGVYKRLDDGYDEQIAALGEGSLIGHIALIDRARRSATCVVESQRAVFLELRRINFDRLFHANSLSAFKVFYQVVNDLVQKLRGATTALTLAKTACHFSRAR